MSTDLPNLKEMSLDKLAEWYGNAQYNSKNRDRADAEFKRRELSWIRTTSIVAIISLIVMGVTSIGSLLINYLSMR